MFKFEVTIYAITASTAANGGDENDDDDDDGKKCDNCFDKRSHQCEKKCFNTLCWRQKKTDDGSALTLEIVTNCSVDAYLPTCIPMANSFKLKVCR